MTAASHPSRSRAVPGRRGHRAVESSCARCARCARNDATPGGAKEACARAGCFTVQRSPRACDDGGGSGGKGRRASLPHDPALAGRRSLRLSSLLIGE